jgi:plasmid stabilization system protein ParE
VNSRVRFADEADTEYREAGRWYEGRRVGLGLEFFDAVDAAIDHVARFPAAGEPVPSVPKDLPVRRHAVTRFPYHVVYLDTSRDIRILAIAHDRRKPGYCKDRIR